MNSDEVVHFEIKHVHTIVGTMVILTAPKKITHLTGTHLISREADE